MGLRLRFLLVASGIAWVVLTTLIPVSGQTNSDSVLKSVELVYTRTNVGSGTYTNLRACIGIPQSLPEQSIHSIVWTPEPDAIDIDIYGQPVAEFYIGTVAPGQTVTLCMQVVGTFSKIHWEINPSSVGSLEDVPIDIVNLYTIDGEYYQITDPVIISTSANIVGGETNPYRIAVLIHDYVAETLSYENDGEWDDAATVLDSETGSCSEYTFVFIALARAAGLPARFAGGSRCRVLSGHSVDDSGHRWAEVYLPNYGWIPFDAQADDVPPGMEATDFGVAAHSHAMVTVRGGGDDLEHMGIQYITRSCWSGSSSWEKDWQVTWDDAEMPATAAVFRITNDGVVLADGSFYGQDFLAGSADIAEWVSVSEPVEPGDVLELDPTKPGQYRKSRGPCSTLVAGVVSTDPGFVLGSEDLGSSSGLSTLDSRSSTADPRLTTDDSALLALLGIVPVKVTDEGGPIKPGDLLVASSTPGYAMRWDPDSGEDACGLIGKALEAMTEQRGEILVLLMVH